LFCGGARAEKQRRDEDREHGGASENDQESEIAAALFLRERRNVGALRHKLCEALVATTG
jgi:hypothetical protein